MGFMKNHENFIKSKLIWMSTALFFKKYDENKLILQISKNMILRFCRSIQTIIRNMFFEISKIKLFSSFFMKNNAVEYQMSSFLIKFSYFFEILITFILRFR